MQSGRNEFTVGVTVLAGFVLFVAVLMFIGQWDTLVSETKQLQVRFKHQAGIQGLRIKDPVRVGGLNVGRIREIRLQEDVVDQVADKRELYVYVTADIPDFIELREDCRISIGTKFVGEGGTLDILDTGSQGGVIAENEVIDGMAAGGFAQLTSTLSNELDATNPASILSQIKSQLNQDDPVSLLAKIHKSVDDINAISSKVRTEIGGEEQRSAMTKIHQIMDNLNDLTGTLRSEFDRHDEQGTLARVQLALATLNDSLERVKTMMQEGDPKIQTALTNVEHISNVVSGELDRQADDSLLAKIHSSMSSAQAGMDNLRTITDTGKELVVINRENLQDIIDNFSETSAHLKATAKEVHRAPWRLLYKPDKPEREYANLMDAVRNFSDAAGSLDQANSKLVQLAKLHPDGVAADDPQLEKIREHIKESFCQFEQAQKKLWNLLKLRG